MGVAGILLSGGRSERMGAPKALLDLGGQSFLSRLLRTMQQGGLDDIVVVTGVHDLAIREEVGRLVLERAPTVVHNPAHAHGQLSSLLAGLGALPSAAEAVVMMLVDHPLVRAATVVQLVTAFRATHAPVVCPMFAGRRGHPVLFGPEALAALRIAPIDQGARSVVRGFGPRCVDCVVDDPGVALDIDTREDYDAAVRFWEAQPPGH